MIVYSYSRPLIKRCAKEFNITSLEKAVHVCNTAIVKKTIKKQPQKQRQMQEEVQNDFEQDIDFDYDSKYDVDQSKEDRDEQKTQQKTQNNQLKKGKNVDIDEDEDEDQVKGDVKKSKSKSKQKNRKALEVDDDDEVEDDLEDDIDEDEDEDEKDKGKDKDKKIKKADFNAVTDDEDDEDKKKEDDEDEDDEGIEEEQFFIDWSFEGLQELLLKNGMIKNKHWLKQELYPLIYQKLIHLVRSVKKRIGKDSRLAEFLACDFILSDDLQISVLEVNSNPQILSVTPDRILRNYKMTLVEQDTIELQTKYLRSRYLRLSKLLRSLLGSKEITTRSIEQKIRQAFRNKLEKGQEISPDNLYVKIIDENFEGPKKYNNLIPNKCLF